MIDSRPKLVFIPFRPNNIKLILAGKKTATSRTKPFAGVGDFFQIKNAYYVVDSVEKKLLQDVAQNYYKQEGCSSPAEFIQEWNDIHTIIGYRPDLTVLFHTFHKRY